VGQKLSGAIGGGVITYSANGRQKVAVATGFISPVWPVQIATAKIAILGVGEDSGRK
jgi:alcohol dehydrogenase (cytochrome c)